MSVCPRQWLDVWRKALGPIADIRGLRREQVDALVIDLALAPTAPILRIVNIDSGALNARPDLLRKVEALCRTCENYSFCDVEFDRRRSKNLRFASYCPNVKQLERLLDVDIL